MRIPARACYGEVKGLGAARMRGRALRQLSVDEYDMPRRSTDRLRLLLVVAVGLGLVGRDLAWLGPIIIAAPDHGTWLGEHRDDAGVERATGDGLEQKFVRAEPHRFEHARTLPVRRQHDDGN